MKENLLEKEGFAKNYRDEPAPLHSFMDLKKYPAVRATFRTAVLVWRIFFYLHKHDGRIINRNM